MTIPKDVQEALDWADKESSVCYSSGTGHSEAKVLARAYRESLAKIEELEKDIGGVQAYSKACSHKTPCYDNSCPQYLCIKAQQRLIEVSDDLSIMKSRAKRAEGLVRKLAAALVHLDRDIVFGRENKSVVDEALALVPAELRGGK